MTWRARAALLALTTLACDPSRPHDDSNEEQTGDGDPNPDAWFLMGQGELGWTEVEDGDSLLMVLGGQGLLMFPMPIRGHGFTLPENPKDYTHPDIPLLDIHLDIEGFNIGFGGHFSRIANYPIPFSILADGTYEFVYITIFVPDELQDPCAIDGLPGELYAELDTADGDTLTWERSVVIEVPADLCN
ncbi:MAG TPA: hypothetical protein VK034_21525 [Enhygromyxa sp.]|nr:hypothetical protein [Enhygromyxa sp.]